jgi:UDP-N-acetylglucosamine--N-acetylmuramyl-(pentapeptide) pyrophosphoryl-undecaprenol N-acetylglucosamine transferase
MTKLCIVAAGGTGGHMFPAEALAREMAARGWRVVLATDHRGEQYAHAFPAEERLALDAATGAGPLGLIKAGVAIFKGVVQARTAFDRLGADVVVGFGGDQGRSHVVGSPVRAEIRALFDRPYVAPPADGPIHLLVTGGSQGARILSETTPRALAALPEALRRRLKVQQQSRPETLEAARQIYLEAGIEAEVAPFFRDMADRLSKAHLVVGRSGASTCAELAVAALPSVLIPLKIATDDHQRLNAKALTDAGAAEVILEDDLTVDRLASTLTGVLSDPARLSAMSAAARSVAIPDAAQRLADLVEATAQPQRP